MSFFKRAVVGALERREEVRAANEVKYESDVARGITKLEEAEKEMKKNNLIVRNRKKLIAPIGINVFNETGKEFGDPVLLNVLMASKGDTGVATDTLIRMAKQQTPPPTATVTDGTGTDAEIDIGSTRDYTDLSGDTTKALQDASSMISTTSTQLPSQQKAMITAKESERTQRYGGGVAGNIMNTLLGGVSGPSVREAVKERYSSMFRTPEEGEQAYTDTMNYMEEVRTKGEASTIPDLPPNVLADVQRQVRKAKKAEIFEAKIGGVIDERLRELRMFIVNKAPSAQQAQIQALLRSLGGGNYKAPDINTLPKAVQDQISEYIDIRREAIKGSTDVFNTTGFNSVYGASSNFLDTTIDGKNQLDIYLGRMIKAGGDSTPNQSNTSNAPKKSSRPTRKIGNKLRDLSGSTVLSSDEIYKRYNVDNMDDFHKKYQSRFVEDMPSIEAGKKVGYLKVYNIEGTKIAIGNGGKTIRQLP